MLPNLGASGSQFEDLLVPNFWGPMLPKSRNHRYAVLGTNRSQTLEPMLYPILEPQVPRSRN